MKSIGKKSAAGISAYQVVIARKQKLGSKDAEKTELIYMIHFDTIRRGQCGEAGKNFLAFNLITAMFMARMSKHQVLDRVAATAYESLQKAWSRAENLSLTTGEYKAMRDFHSFYFKMLPNLEVGFVSDCARAAHDLLGGNMKVAA